MPELPDLQAFSQNLEKKLKGKQVKKITLLKSKSKTPAAKFKKEIEKQKVRKVYREGKELRIEFSNGAVLGMHLMLHGGLNFFEGKNDKKHAILEILFTDNSGLALSDWQRAALPSLNPAKSEVPDALDDEVNLKFLRDKFKSRASVKNVLLDQKVIRGIGNAYADEILWKSGISPFSIANKIPDNKIKILAKNIRSVLKNAEKQILKSHPDIISGEIRDFLNIHNAKKKESPTGGSILNSVAGSRKTYYTDEQELYE